MHQSQIACIVHHAFGSSKLINALQMMAEEQWLVASSTSETHIGGDLRSSICALNTNETGFVLEKDASVLSYGEKADAILITCRKSIDATEKDQVLVLSYQKDCTLIKISEWDTLGFRGTCSAGYKIKAQVPKNHIFPTPFSKILNDTMQPIAHIYWSSVWLGMANLAVKTTQKAVTDRVMKQQSGVDIQAFKFAELNAKLSSMRSNLTAVIKHYNDIRSDPTITANEKMNFTTKVNDLKINSSRYLIEIVSDAMMLTGISSYSIRSKNSLCQLLRDAFGAPLMVSNDRLLNHNSTLHLVTT